MTKLAAEKVCQYAEKKTPTSAVVVLQRKRHSERDSPEIEY